MAQQVAEVKAISAHPALRLQTTPGHRLYHSDGDQVRFLMPVQQALYPLGHLPNPIFMALVIFSDKWKVLNFICSDYQSFS